MEGKQHAGGVEELHSHEAKCCYKDEELWKTRTTPLHGVNGDAEATRREIRSYFNRTFCLFERLHEILRDDQTLYQQPEKLRHPLIFYLAHTAVLYVNKLRLARLIPTRIDEHIESTCAVGVDEMSWDDLTPSHYKWPTPSEARAYRNKVRKVVDNLIQTMELKLPINWNSPWWVILMGIEHERIHLETSSVLMRQLAIEHVKPHPFWRICPNYRKERTQAPQNELLPVAEGTVTLGKSFDHPLYGWDNEFGEYTARVPGFKASKYLVSNAEFYEFVLDKGYTTKQHWTEDGWNFVQWKKATHPVFWVPKPSSGQAGANSEPQFKYRAITTEMEMPWDWPVDVNYLEAKAFCNWKRSKTQRKIRLPTEDEWSLLRDTCYPEIKQGTADQPYWQTAPGNINLEHYASACPVDQFELRGFFDVVGNVWQHTETDILPFKGFKVHQVYDDFSVPTFDTRHNLIKGGSFISTGNEATRLSRYAFRRHFYQHAGFRYVESEIDCVAKKMPAPWEPEVARAAEMHYSKTNKLGLPNVAVAAVQHVAAVVQDIRTAESKEAKTSAQGVSAAPKLQLRRALDMGCSCGRGTFELAKQLNLEHVLGLDPTTRFLRFASQLQAEGRVAFSVKTLGDLDEYLSADLSELGLTDASKRCEFWQADACNLDDKYTGFDLVLSVNLLSKLYAPAAFLKTIHTRVNAGGLLALADSFDWNPDVTPREAWLGGRKHAGESVSPLEDIERALGQHWAMVGKPVDLPWALRMTERSFNHSVSQLSVWRLVKKPQ